MKRIIPNHNVYRIAILLTALVGAAVWGTSISLGEAICEEKENSDKLPIEKAMEELRRLNEIENPSAAQLELQKTLYTRVMNHMASTRNHGRFHLKGTVVDQNGKPLNDVTMVVAGAKMANLGLDIKYEGTRKQISEFFDVSVSGYAGVTLRFEKNNYYNSEIDFDAEHPSPEMIQAALAEKPLKGPLIKNENIRIAMTEVGQTVNPLEYRIPLTLATDGKIKAVDFGKQPAVSMTQLDESSAAAQDKHIVYISADRDEKGNILVEERRRTGDNRSVLIPKRVRLIMSKPDDGFVRIEPADSIHPFRQMREAPVGDYQRELVFSADELWAITKDDHADHDMNVYFYFKVNKLYGKGTVGSIFVDETPGGRVVLLAVPFRLNPDGSRNVNTREW